MQEKKCLYRRPSSYEHNCSGLGPSSKSGGVSYKYAEKCSDEPLYFINIAMDVALGVLIF